MIVDTLARPDLFESMQKGTLHSITCPQCGQKGTADAPLLLYRPDNVVPILFSPAQRTTIGRDQEQAIELINKLRESLGDIWKEEWLAEGLAYIDRSYLYTILDKELLRQLVKYTLSELGALQQSHPDAYTKTALRMQRFIALVQIVQQFLQAPTISYIKTHPELLSDEAEGLLKRLITEARIWSNERIITACELCFEVRRQNERESSKLDQEMNQGTHTQNLAGEVILTESDIFIPPQLQEIFNQASEFESHYDSGRGLPALNEAIAAWKAILGDPAFILASKPFQLSVLFAAGNAYLKRYKLLTQLPDLNQTINLWNEVVERHPHDQALPTILCYFGLAWHNRYNHTSQLEDLEHAIKALQAAIEHASSENPDMPALITCLGNALSDRYQRTARLEDLEQVIFLYRTWLEPMSANTAMDPVILNNLIVALRARFLHTGRLEDLEQAIKAAQICLDGISKDSPELPRILSNLGLCLCDYYQRKGVLEDLKQAIGYLLSAVNLTSADLPELADRLINLGAGLHLLYEQSGTRGDLEQAIEAYQRSIESTPPNSPHLPGRLSNLGLAFRDRYDRTGRLEDLEQAIDLYRRAIEYPVVNAFDLPNIYGNLGLGLRERYHHSRHLEDLEQAIVALQRAVDQTSVTSPELPRFLSNLGLGLHDRYNYTGRLKDLKPVIEAYQKAVELTPTDSPSLGMRLNNLGNGFQARYRHTGQLEDLNLTIEAYEKVSQRIPGNAPYLPICLNNLGASVQDLYKRTGLQEHLQRAIVVYEEACQKGMQLALKEALMSAHNWGNWALERAAWDEAVRAYAYGVQALEQIYRTQLLRTSQETWLSEAFGLHARAAYALARCNRLQEAVTTLEQGRARGLSEVLARDRADLERIQQKEPDLYAKYQEAVERLRQLERSERESKLSANGIGIAGGSTSASLDYIHQAREELERTLIRIREIPDYEDFLVTPTFLDVQAVAQVDVPVVYLATTQVGSMALLVHAEKDRPEVIWADNLTTADLDALLVRYARKTSKRVIGGYLPGQLSNPEWFSDALTKIISRLGKRLMRLVATRLRELGATGAVLIPTGFLGLLPLHATRYQVGSNKRCLLDEIDVVYSPSARVFAAMRREEEARRRQVVSLYFVGVGNPLPDREAANWAKDELQRILPKLQQSVQTHRPFKPDDGEHVANNSGPVFSLPPFQEQALKNLQMLCLQSPEELVHAGHDILDAAIILGQIPGLPGDIAASLALLVARLPPSLSYARAELEAVLGFLPAGAATVFYEHLATRDALWELLPQATIVHFACHGSFNAKMPLDSALLLAQETTLTLRDILNAQSQHLGHLRLAFLSACQTALTDFQRIPDESVGLLSGFLQAGVPSVVGTLWPVNDVSSALLVTRFYELYLLGDRLAQLPPQPPARALRIAQNWLRNLTNNHLLNYLKEIDEIQNLPARFIVDQLPLVRKAIREGRGDDQPFVEPYHWAGFVCYGVM